VIKVVLDFSTSINEYIANTESAVSVLVNGDEVAVLSGENRSFLRKLQLSNGKNQIVVRRYYVRSPDCAVWWKQIFGALLGLILLAVEDGTPFFCQYETEECIELELPNEEAVLEVRAVQKDNDPWPLFLICGDGCKWTSSRKITMSKKELEDTYKERKRLLSLPLWIPFALCVLGLLSLLMNGYTTTVVALLALAAVFGGCSLISILALRKQYQKLLNQI
jgi:hypothetical protein